MACRKTAHSLKKCSKEPGDAERQGIIQFSLHMSTKVPATTLITTLFQPEGDDEGQDLSETAPSPLTERFVVSMPETNEHQAGCVLRRMLGHLDSWHLESNAHLSWISDRKLESAEGS
jgi:hypothetical protein